MSSSRNGFAPRRSQSVSPWGNTAPTSRPRAGTLLLRGLPAIVALLFAASGCASGEPVPEGESSRPDYRSVEQKPPPDTGPPSDDGDASARSGASDDAPSSPAERRALMRKAARYQKRLVRAILERWDPPAFEKSRIQKLGNRAVVYVRVDDDGHISSYKFRHKSGSEAFDDSITECLETFSEDGPHTVPLPDDSQLRDAIIRRGFNLQKWAPLESDSQ